MHSTCDMNLVQEFTDSNWYTSKSIPPPLNAFKKFRNRRSLKFVEEEFDHATVEAGSKWISVVSSLKYCIMCLPVAVGQFLGAVVGNDSKHKERNRSSDPSQSSKCAGQGKNSTANDGCDDMGRCHLPCSCKGDTHGLGFNEFRVCQLQLWSYGPLIIPVHSWTPLTLNPAL